MDGSHRLGGPAVARAHWHPGLAGYPASTLDLCRAHGLSHARAFAEIAAARRVAGARRGDDRLWCAGLRCGRLSDLFSDSPSTWTMSGAFRDVILLSPSRWLRYSLPR